MCVGGRGNSEFCSTACRHSRFRPSPTRMESNLFARSRLCESQKVCEGTKSHICPRVPVTCAELASHGILRLLLGSAFDSCAYLCVRACVCVCVLDANQERRGPAFLYEGFDHSRKEENFRHPDLQDVKTISGKWFEKMSSAAQEVSAYNHARFSTTSFNTCVPLFLMLTTYLWVEIKTRVYRISACKLPCLHMICFRIAIDREHGYHFRCNSHTTYIVGCEDPNEFLDAYF